MKAMLTMHVYLVAAAVYADGSAREPTEIQNLQVGDGDVPRGLAIPLYMVFPRIFTCPTSISEVRHQLQYHGHSQTLSTISPPLPL